MSESISLKSLGVHLIREAEKLNSAAALHRRGVSVAVKEIEITLPIAAVDQVAPQPVVMGEREPMFIVEAVKQLEAIEARAIIGAEALQKAPVESRTQFKLRIRF